MKASEKRKIIFEIKEIIAKHRELEFCASVFSVNKGIVLSVKNGDYTWERQIHEEEFYNTNFIEQCEERMLGAAERIFLKIKEN